MTSDADAEVDAPRTLADPTPSEAATLVDRALDRGDLVTLFGPCTVDYEGRASHVLGLTPRHVLCKPDGATLVHEVEGQRPTNWQPPGATQTVRVVGDDAHSEGESAGDEDGRVDVGDDSPIAEGGPTDARATQADAALVLRAERESPAEVLAVRFAAVRQVSAYPAGRSATTALEVSGSEADLRQRVLDAPDLVEAGFTPLATERETAAGPVDVYGRDAAGNAVVVELKRRRVGPDAVGQLERYVDALRRDLHAGATVRGVLVAPSVTERARELLAEQGFEFVSLSP